MGLKEKAKKAFALKEEYLMLYEREDISAASKKEMEYMALRMEVLKEIDSTNARQRSEPIKNVKKRVADREKPKRIETGIKSLDMELVNESMKHKGIPGGFALGNFIQIAGSRGSGKSSILLKILTGFSMHEKVCWFDFEMGENRVVEKLEDFTHNEDNLLYYASSRLLDDVVGEIKLLHATGINHFVIDSTMKIIVPGADNYNRFSAISSELSSLTSSLGINIYMINQLSQESEKTGILAIKHGNDAEYDADFILYVMKIRKINDRGKPESDEFGQPVFSATERLIKCTKNRQDERLFSVRIPKSEIVNTVIEIEYEA